MGDETQSDLTVFLKELSLSPLSLRETNNQVLEQVAKDTNARCLKLAAADNDTESTQNRTPLSPMCCERKESLPGFAEVCN